MVPILLICFNNGYYIKNTIEQLLFKGVNYNSITILDNNSNGEETVEILKTYEKLCKIIHFSSNYGHLVWQRSEIFDSLPEYFIISDPDLEYSKNLPNDFIEILIKISDQYSASKVGFALEISSSKQFYSSIYHHGKTIEEWESQFWKSSLEKFQNTEIYLGETDTTFFLGCKSRLKHNMNIRVASNFTCKHLPWYPKHNFSLGKNRLKEIYENGLYFSTTGTLILNSFCEIRKNDQTFSIELDGSHRDNFWKNIYINWEIETFKIFDKYVQPDKIVIDLGTWIGPTVLYCASLGGKIIGVEADHDSVNTLENNCNLNSFKSVKIIEKAVYKNNDGVYFGENIYRNDGMNASTSQIVNETSNKNKYFIETITFYDIIKNLESKEVTLVKVDIEGGEEFVLLDILNWCYKYNIPAYISFHFTWWSIEGKESFSRNFHAIFETFNKLDLVEHIKQHPFDSILFEL